MKDLPSEDGSASYETSDAERDCDRDRIGGLRRKLRVVNQLEHSGVGAGYVDLPQTQTADPATTTTKAHKAAVHHKAKPKKPAATTTSATATAEPVTTSPGSGVDHDRGPDGRGSEADGGGPEGEQRWSGEEHQHQQPGLQHQPAGLTQ